MNKIVKSMLITMTFLPWVFGLGSEIFPEIGLIFIFLDNVVALPISWIENPLFERASDIGGYIPTIWGRIALSGFYGFVLAIFMSWPRSGSGRAR
jgi:hypothetical protein